MSTRKTETYDEIVARTVVEPDGSWKPTPQQLRDSEAGIRAMDVDERALATKVEQALAAAGFGDLGLGVEVEHQRLVLTGSVVEVATVNAIEDAVRRIEGLDSIDNRLHVAPTPG